MPGDDQGVDHHGGSVLLNQSFDLGTLSATRRAVLGTFPVDELAQGRARAFLAAINEGMINAIQHGGGGGNVTVCRTHGRLIAVVQDIRRTIPFVLPQDLPAVTAEGGRGLWIIVRSCDTARVESGRTGLRLVMEVDLRDKSGASTSVA